MGLNEAPGIKQNYLDNVKQHTVLQENGASNDIPPLSHGYKLGRMLVQATESQFCPGTR